MRRRIRIISPDLFLKCVAELQDLNRAMRMTRSLKLGETYINRENGEAYEGFHAGRKKSGIGGANGRHGFYEYMETQAVYIQRVTDSVEWAAVGGRKGL